MPSFFIHSLETIPSITSLSAPNDRLLIKSGLVVESFSSLADFYYNESALRHPPQASKETLLLSSVCIVKSISIPCYLGIMLIGTCLIITKVEHLSVCQWVSCIHFSTNVLLNISRLPWSTSVGLPLLEYLYKLSSWLFAFSWCINVHFYFLSWVFFFCSYKERAMRGKYDHNITVKYVWSFQK